MDIQLKIKRVHDYPLCDVVIFDGGEADAVTPEFCQQFARLHSRFMP